MFTSNRPLKDLRTSAGQEYIVNNPGYRANRIAKKLLRSTNLQNYYHLVYTATPAKEIREILKNLVEKDKECWEVYLSPEPQRYGINDLKLRYLVALAISSEERKSIIPKPKTKPKPVKKYKREFKADMVIANILTDDALLLYLLTLIEENLTNGAHEATAKKMYDIYYKEATNRGLIEVA